MKKIFAIIVLLVALDLGLTYFVGIQAEKAYIRTIALLNDTPGIEANVLSFQRGFFSSKATTEVIVGQDKYNTDDTIFHGPVAIDFKNISQTRVGFGAVHSIIQTPSFNVPVVAIVVFPFTGGAEFTSKGEGFKFKDQSVALIEGSGWDAKGSVNSKFDTYSFQNVIPIITLMNPAMGVEDKTEIKDLNMKVNYKKMSPEIDLKLAYAIGNITNQAQMIALSNLKLDGELAQRAETFDTFIQAEFDKLVIKDETIGPCILKLKVANIDNALADLIKKMGLNKPVSSKEIQDAVNLVVKRGFLIQIDNIDAKVKEGEFVLKGQMNLGGPQVQQPYTADNIFAASEGNIYLQMPKTVFQALLKNNATFKMAKDPDYKTLLPEQQEAKLNDEINRINMNIKNSKMMTETEQNVIIKFSFSKGRYLVEGLEVTKPDLN